ncbi:MAG: GNAT family N-acetyltransferase [Methanomicrobiales archaeon]|nr:GNAT family N-acetyltransferase [Methanomicrobiales archaeon]
MPDYTCTPITPEDRTAVIDIFNYYVENSFAAFPEQKVPYAFFDLFLQQAHDYPPVAVRDAEGRLLGFGLLHAHNPMPAFAHTAEISYFVRPDRTGMGVGSRMLEYLEKEGRRRGISCILAAISSRNEGSIRFHARHGFSECGRFRSVGKKRGEFFDTVWMQKFV